MTLHHDKILFADIIAKASVSPVQGGLGINPLFIEKDYWITLALYHLSESKYREDAVFKGGTSLTKGYNIGQRFSEDLDLAIIKKKGMKDSQLKTIIRSTEKVMARELTEIKHPLSSKGSRYRKSFYTYPQTILDSNITLIPGQLLFEINSFANPYPFQLKEIRSFVYDYLKQRGREDLIREFNLNPFEINVLDKRTTMTEKLVSLLRYSLGNIPLFDLEAKIRHFYDLYYLFYDKECNDYLGSIDFKHVFLNLLNHDRQLFDKPLGWNKKKISSSPLFSNFEELWLKLSKRYENELPSLAFSMTIPSPDEIRKTMLNYIEILSIL